jgi:hypothetical protein
MTLPGSIRHRSRTVKRLGEVCSNSAVVPTKQWLVLSQTIGDGLFSMTFKKSVKQIADIADRYCPGLQALRGVDKARVIIDASGNLYGSVDVDEALKAKLPNDARWDYVIARKRLGGDEHLHWIEVHPASSTKNIDEIEKKLDWLKGWLNTVGKPSKAYRGEWIWIASGKSTFNQNSPQLKRLAAMGVMFKGGHFRIPTD